MREQLREATEAVHARLDEKVGNFALSDGRDFINFLAAQYAARTSVELALQQTPPLGIGIPPSQTRFLLLDLAELGVDPPPPIDGFALANPAQSLGTAWVLAGSSLGNRAILARRRKAGLRGAGRFLSEGGLATYFSDLLGILSTPFNDGETDQATIGALATFELFEQAFASVTLEEDAA